MGVGLVLNRSRQVPAEDTPAFGAIAERFRRAGDLERAVALCRDGLKKFPDHLSARVTLGWALLDQGQYEEARHELQQVLSRAPDNLAAIRGLAELHDRAENTVELSLTGPGPWPPEPAAIEAVAPETAPADAALIADEGSREPAMQAPAAMADVRAAADLGAALADLQTALPTVETGEDFAGATSIESAAGAGSIDEPLAAFETAAATLQIDEPADAPVLERFTPRMAEVEPAVAQAAPADAVPAEADVVALDEVATFDEGYAAVEPIAAQSAAELPAALSLDSTTPVDDLERLLIDDPLPETAAAAVSTSEAPAATVVFDAVDAPAMLESADAPIVLERADAPVAIEAADAPLMLEPLLLESDATGRDTSSSLVDLDAHTGDAASLESLLQDETALASAALPAAEAVIDDEVLPGEAASPVAAFEGISDEPPAGAEAFALTAPEAGVVDLSLDAAAFALDETAPSPSDVLGQAFDFDAPEPEMAAPVYLVDADLREVADMREAVDLAAAVVSAPPPAPVLVSVAPAPEPVQAAAQPAPEPVAAPAAPKRQAGPDPAVATFEEMLKGIAIRRIQSSAYNLAG